VAVVIASAAAPGGAGRAVAADGQQASAGDTVLGEVVVTARRRAESLQDTPVAVTALSADALDAMQVTGTTDLDKVVPNLQFHSYGTLTGNNSAAQVFIRGIGQTDATPAVDPGVGLYIDDVYLGRSVGGAMEMRDIANTQVLRGPQGTLFGRNTVGGAVLLTTNGPGEGAGDTVRASVGEDNLIDGFVAADLFDTGVWSARASGGFRKRDGYVRRVFDNKDLGDENSLNGQVALRFKPMDNLSFTLRYDGARQKENGSPFVFQSINEAALFVGIASINAGCPDVPDGFPPPPTLVGPTADPNCGNDAQYLGHFTNGGTAPAFSTLHNHGGSLIAEWNLNDQLTLKSITADRDLRWTGARDADNTPLLILHTNYNSHSKQFSQELQAVYSGERLDGVIGLYYFDEDTFDRLLVPLSNPGTSYDTQRVWLGTKSKAAFTEWTWKFTDQLSATGGIRYTDESKTLRAIMFNVSPATAPEPAIPTDTCDFGGAPPTQTGCLFLTTNQFKRSFTDTTMSGSIQYRWSDAVMTYVSYSEGFKSGGFNQRYNATPPDNAPLSFGAETATTWEIGAKLNPLDNLRVNAALFTTDYDNIQMTYRLGVVPLLFNAGKASIDGGELEVFWAATANLTVDAGAGYLHSGFDSIIDPPPIGSPPQTPTATVNLDSELPFTPDWTTHIGVAYTFALGSGWTITPRVDSSFTGGQYFDAGNSVEISQTGGVTLWNGSTTLESPDTKWRITLAGQNLGDKLYRVAGTSSLTTSSGYAEVINARPRTLSLTAQYRF
jgi:iron complex outermembrane receptor protein